jgi:hypothetical protein
MFATIVVLTYVYIANHTLTKFSGFVIPHYTKLTAWKFHLYNNYSETRNLIGQQPCRIRQSCTGNSEHKFLHIILQKFHCTIPFDFEVSLQLLRRWFSCMNKFLIDTSVQQVATRSVEIHQTMASTTSLASKFKRFAILKYSGRESSKLLWLSV